MPIGPLGVLAQRVRLFVMTEMEIEKQAKKQAKSDLIDEKRAKLLKRIEEERAAAVGPEALNLGMQAMQASADAALLKKNAAKKAKFEKDSHVFDLKISLDNPQPHFQELCSQ